MSVVIPDSIEPVEGWKLLRVKRRWMYSPQQRYFFWRPQKKVVAQCLYGRHTPDSEALPPHTNCTCGIYMVSTPRSAMNYYDRDAKFALVKLKGWGVVIPAERGARVQFAYPTEIHLINNNEDERAAFEETWGVPTKLLTEADAWQADELLLPKGPLQFNRAALAFMLLSIVMFVMNTALFVSGGFGVIEGITSLAWGITLAITTSVAFMTRTRKPL